MKLAFCEPVWATTSSREHIRVLDGEPMLSGGIESAALCGADLARGWDLATEVTPIRIRRGAAAETNPTCTRCGAIALALLEETP